MPLLWWLGAAGGKHGLNMSVMVGPEGQQLGISISHSRRSEWYISMATTVCHSVDLEEVSCLLQASISIASSSVLGYKLFLGSSLHWTFQQQPWVTFDAKKHKFPSLLHTQIKHQEHFYSLFLTTFPDTLSGMEMPTAMNGYPDPFQSLI